MDNRLKVKQTYEVVVVLTAKVLHNRKYLEIL
jgi:hypothetical protein